MVLTGSPALYSRCSAKGVKVAALFGLAIESGTGATTKARSFLYPSPNFSLFQK